MSKIRWKCLHCGKSLNVGQKLLGKTVNCPSCGKPIKLPTLTPVVTASAPSPSLASAVSSTITSTSIDPAPLASPSIEYAPPVPPSVFPVPLASPSIASTPTAAFPGTVSDSPVLPQFSVQFKTDSIFDEEGPASVFDEPSPKPQIPNDFIPELPPANASAPPSPDNPFDFFAGAAPAAKPEPAPATAPKPKFVEPTKEKKGRSKLVAPKANPFAEPEMDISIREESIPTLVLPAVPVDSSPFSSAETAVDQSPMPKPGLKPLPGPRARASILTWIFLAWAIAATAAAVYFATQKPAAPAAAPAKASPNGEKPSK